MEQILRDVSADESIADACISTAKVEEKLQKLRGIVGAPNPEKPLKAVIDVGSNTVRISIWYHPYENTEPVLKLKVSPGLAKDLNGKGNLNEQACAETIQALSQYALVLETLKNEKYLTDNDITSVATAALRDAKNGPAFLNKIHGSTGLQLNLISGEEEAMYISIGLADKFPEGKIFGLDLGGGSLEGAYVRAGKPRGKKSGSVPLGTWRIKNADNKREKITSELFKFDKSFKKCDTIVLMGGTWRQIMKSYCLHNNFNMDNIDDINLDAQKLLKHAELLETASGLLPQLPEGKRESLCELFNFRSERTPQITSARLLLEEMIRKYDIQTVAMTTSNTRYGRMLAMLKDPDEIAKLKEKFGVIKVKTPRQEDEELKLAA